MTNDAKAVFQRNPDLLAAKVNDEAVMMSVEHEQYFGLNGLGAVVWDLLESPASPEGVARRICEEYDVTEERCLQDVLGFLAEMEKLGLVSRAE